MSIENEGSNNPEAPIRGIDLRQQLNPNGILDKPHRPDKYNKAVNECNLSEDLRQELITMAGLDAYHILRMLRQSETERNFGLAYLQYRDDILSKFEKTRRKILAVIGSEGADTQMFWTFAPYLFKSLTKKGIPNQEALEKILGWARDGVSGVTESNLQPGQKQQDWSKLHLKGLEKFDRETETNGGWVLDEDPNHISHKFTEQEADHIADILIAENEK